MSARRILAWGREMLAPDTFERTLAATQADLDHELAALSDPAARRKMARAGRWLMLRVLFFAMAHDRREHRRGLRWWLFAAPLLAVVVGLAGAPPQLGMLPQLAFCAVGLGLGYLMASTPARVLAREAAAGGWIAVALLWSVPFIGAGGAGTTRWLTVGPLSIHMATLLTPFIALALARLFTERRSWQGVALIAAAQAALAATSDLGAALTLGAIALPLALLGGGVRAALAVLVPCAAGALAAGYLDPLLAATARSEGILGALGTTHPLWAVLGVAALGVAIGAPLGAKHQRPPWARAMAWALALSLAVPLVLSAVIAVPVPLLGYGGSAIVATYLGLGAVITLERGGHEQAGQGV